VSASDSAELPSVSVEEAILEVSVGVTLVDVREQDEWDAGHSPDARLIPLSQLQERAAELPRDARLLIVCQAGSRSLRASNFLRLAGIDAINVEGGMAAWFAAGGPVVVDSHAANTDEG
jgi:rhodanese-related sulfurtransferase